jgi:multiple sugar transport system ATP-binding protein
MVDTSQGSADDEVMVGIRPEHLRLAEPDNADSLPARVVLTEHLGDQVLVYLSIDGAPEDLCMKLSGHAFRFRPGHNVRLNFPPEDCLLFDQAGIAFPRLK